MYLCSVQLCKILRPGFITETAFVNNSLPPSDSGSSVHTEKGLRSTFCPEAEISKIYYATNSGPPEVELRFYPWWSILLKY
jgi:hypothetical protein